MERRPESAPGEGPARPFFVSEAYMMMLARSVGRERAHDLLYSDR
jgi:hypothetical protein